MNTPNHDYHHTSLAVLKAESDEKFNSISSQIKEVSTLTRELLDQIADLKLGVGILTHNIRILEADHENTALKRESQANIVKDISVRFEGLIEKIDAVESKVSALEKYSPLLAEITEQRNQNIARANTLESSFISSLGGSMGDVVKWGIMLLAVAGLSNAGHIINAITEVEEPEKQQKEEINE